MWSAVNVIVLAYVGWCVLAYLVQDRVLYPRGVTGEGEGPPARSGVEQVWIEAGAGTRVEAWFVPAPGTADVPGPAVIFAHGNGELIDYCLPWVAGYLELGVSVLLPEYRGYGRSGGSPSQGPIVEDMEQFYDWLVARPEVDPRRILFHGRSLGGGVLAALAGRRESAGIILESTFTSVASIWNRFGLPTFLCHNPFRTDVVMSEYSGPVLIFHGTHDDIIPVRHGRRLHEIVSGSTYVEMPAGHNDFPPNPQAYWDAIRKFLGENGLSSVMREGV